MLLKINCIVCGRPLQDEKFRKDKGFPLWYRAHQGYTIGSKDYLDIINEKVIPEDIAIYFCGPECSSEHHEQERKK